MIETMCNEILGNYTKKDDQLTTAAFGTRPKRRLNRVMDALDFEYLDHDRLDEGAGGAKRKKVVSILRRQAARPVKEDEKALKRMKIASEPKALAPKKRKLDKIPSAKPKIHDAPEKTLSPPSPSTAEASEILKVMIESPPLKLLSPLGLELTNLLQKKEIPSATIGRDGGQKKRCMMNILHAIEQTPPPTSVDKTSNLLMWKLPLQLKAKISQPPCPKLTRLYQTWLWKRRWPQKCQTKGRRLRNSLRKK
jgi:hypothetical protein